MEKNIERIQKNLKHKLDHQRYIHTIGVMYIAASLAMRYGCDIQKAMLAGLLHDCAKCIPSDKKIKLCIKNKIKITEIEKRNPFLLHAKLGAFIAEKKYKIKDKEIITAIINHTTGKPEMTMIEKIIFIADYIEPQRNKAKNLKEIRIMAYQDLDKAVAMIMRDTLEYLRLVSGEIDPATELAYDYYKRFL